jgi:ATP-dependent helicase YprA (DUF1998 family)
MDQFNPIKASENIKESFIDYITTSFGLADKTYAEELKAELEKSGNTAKGPYLDVSGSYKTALPIRDLISIGEASPLFASLEPIPEKERELKIDRPLYSHQQEALLKANAGNNLVVTTGTGSGKTECFLIPIINALLREQECGTLDYGVRAIIIYPMNALANDQIKRMRALLKGHEAITFGLYNGNTQHTEKKALEEYKIANGKDAVPLKNEMISRERMQTTPPHILITNYSMLEYMMLRPKDDSVFSGAKLRYIVLDEAHVYRGTTGMETAMLMRRLRARISTRDTVQYILTSATLGGKDANDAIVNFAERLCEVPFKPENIIRSQDATPPMKENAIFPSALFTDIIHSGKPISDVLRDYNVTDFSKEGDDSEKLFELLLHCNLFKRFVESSRKPITISELQSSLSKEQPISIDQLIDFISICTRAEKGKTSLIKARYHFFVRALEGAYVTLNEPKQLFLQRKENVVTGGKNQAVFEIAVCSDCGRLALVGAEDECGYLKQVARKNDSNPKECEYFLIDDGSIGNDLLDDEDEDEKGQPSEENDYIVCPSCGKIALKGSLRFGDICDCHDKYVAIKKVKRTKNGTARCAACGFGSLRAFYLGNDAATAVLGTELFEQLPDETIKEEPEKSKTDVAKVSFNLFTDGKAIKPVKLKRTRQFLCFSDSRSEAAFFANYMEKSYQEFLRRRAILHVADQMKQSSVTEISVPAFVDKLTRYFDANKTFDIWSPGTKEDKDSLHLKSESNAWIAILNEMFNARRGTSLPSLGLISFDYRPNLKYAEPLAKMYGLSVDEGKALLNLLTMDAVYTGAINAGSAIELNPAEREYIFFSQYEKLLVKRKNSESKSNESGWAGRKRENGNYYPNSRIQRLVQATGCTPDKADEFLSNYWDGVFAPSSETYTLNAGDFNVKLYGNSTLKFFRCKKCGRITAHNVKNHCASVKCSGELIEIDPEEYIKNNHYVRLYRTPQMQSLQIKEHTAQLSKNQQTRYQQAFVNKDINALSCSTTFEMGVDVGSLETVYMRNVPPSPANYVQRAGRAGRALHTAAFVLTYAKLSSHDFTFYQAPEKIISGTIQAPVFELENEKVVNRHIYAVALSKFFALHEEIYNGDNQTVLLNEGGYEVFKDYLHTQPDDLTKLLKKSIPPKLHHELGIDDYSWTEKLIGEDGVLEIAVAEFRDEVSQLEKEVKARQRTHDLQTAASVEYALRQFRCGKDDHQRPKSLIDFLVRNNILPKYGFPVDTVELQVNSSVKTERGETLQLARDLQVAIAEYAPGSEVIADGQRYVSRYIRKLPGKDNSSAWEQGFYCECPNCNEPNFTSKPLTKHVGAECISCGKKIPGIRWQPTLEPRRGFWTEGKPTPAPLRKPERDYKTADYYVGDLQRKEIEKMKFEVNGNVVELESTANDSLAVVGMSTYSVCPVCGYASETGIPLEHKDARGFICRNKEGNHKDYRLSHTFKTFVAKISFFTLDALDYNTMLSVMYALLEGLSRELGIERTDLKGCLHQVLWAGSSRPIFSIVLYDAVAGGAGHVRRLVTKDAAVFKQVLVKALSIVKNCNCDPSCYQCLRNYYNSQVHDLLDRKKAAAFLQGWVGTYTPIVEDSENNTQNKEVKILSDERSVMAYNTWKEFGEAYTMNGLTLWDECEIPKDCITFAEMEVDNHHLTPDFIWPDYKVAVFEISDDTDTQPLSEYGWSCYKMNVDPMALKARFRGE